MSKIRITPISNNGFLSTDIVHDMTIVCHLMSRIRIPSGSFHSHRKIGGKRMRGITSAMRGEVKPTFSDRPLQAVWSASWWHDGRTDGRKDCHVLSLTVVEKGQRHYCWKLLANYLPAVLKILRSKPLVSICHLRYKTKHYLTVSYHNLWHHYLLIFCLSGLSCWLCCYGYCCHGNKLG